MSSIIESEKPQQVTESLDSAQEETCWCEGEAVCCKHSCCACQTADQEVELRDVVRVVFMDHAQDLGQPLVCTVYGVIEHIDNIFINVTSWHPEDLDDDNESNRTTYTIIRSCIKRLDVFT